MTCKDCIHFEACVDFLYSDYDCCDNIETSKQKHANDDTCVHFKATADVEEVRHGEWIYHECVSSYDGCKSGYSCSMCNAFVDEEIFDTDEFHKAFCGNCGAKMDGGREENEG